MVIRTPRNRRAGLGEWFHPFDDRTVSIERSILHSGNLPNRGGFVEKSDHMLTVAAAIIGAVAVARLVAAAMLPPGW